MSQNEIKNEAPITCLLPKKIYGDYDSFIALGFQFESHAIHKELYNATLPKGWTMHEETNGAFHLFDEKGRRRVSGDMSHIFMGMGLDRRYDIRESYNNKENRFFISVVDWDGTILFTTTGQCKVRLAPTETGFERTEEYKGIIKEYQTFIQNNFPDWQDPTKYWD